MIELTQAERDQTMSLFKLRKMVEALEAIAEARHIDPQDMTIMARVGQGKKRRVTGWSFYPTEYALPTFRIE